MQLKSKIHSTMTFNIIRLNLTLSCTVAIVGLLSGCQPHDGIDASNWKTDCVGSMQIRLPDNADVSAHSISTLLSNIEISRAWSPTTFLDGQEDGYASFCMHGCFLISHPTTEENLKKVVAITKKVRQTAKNNINEWFPNKINQDNRLIYIDDPAHNILGWHTKNSYFILKTIGSSAMTWSVSANNNAEAQSSKIFLESLMQAEPRNFGTSPAKNGLCLPYTFIPTDNQQERHISSTYRLESHPDITIWLKDNGNPPSLANQAPDEPTTQEDNQRFWNIIYQDRKKYRSLFLRDAKIAGMNGKLSVMELIREDGTLDYGYFASAHDDASQDNATTNLQLFVIRNAKNAIAKGIEPIGKNEFLKMAQTIAASVKKRPVSAQ
jgi:hypothetical protein